MVKILKKQHIYKNKGLKNYNYKSKDKIIGIICMKNLTLNYYHLKMLKFYLRKKMKKIGTIWLKIFINFNNTKKPLESRMGKGKGPIVDKLVYLKKNEIIFLIKKNSNLSDHLFKQVLKRLLYLLPKHFKMLYKTV